MAVKEYKKKLNPGFDPAIHNIKLGIGQGWHFCYGFMSPSKEQTKYQILNGDERGACLKLASSKGKGYKPTLQEAAVVTGFQLVHESNDYLAWVCMIASGIADQVSSWEEADEINRKMNRLRDETRRAMYQKLGKRQ